MRSFGVNLFIFAIGISLLAGALFGVGWGWAHFRLWKAEYSGRALEIEKTYAGKAILAEAENSRRARIEEARAKHDSAEHLAQAEIIKARGVAEANNIMSKSLGGPEGYLRWKYIEMLEETGQDSNTIVYIPTEATMPILEAGRVNDAAPTNFNDIP